MPIFSTAFCTEALEKLVPLPSHTNLTREQFSPASLGADGVGVEVDCAVLAGDLRDGVGDAGMHRTDQERALLLGNEALGHARAGRRIGLGVRCDPLDLAARARRPWR